MKGTSKGRLVILLGAGTSHSAGMSSTAMLTARILSGRQVTRAPDDRYYLADAHERSVTHDLAVPHVKRVLDAARTVIDNYYSQKDDRPTTYEDIYFLVEQVRHCVSREYDNPAIQPLVDKLSTALGQSFPYTSNHPNGLWSLDRLVVEVAHYIRDIVWHLLSTTPPYVSHLDAIVDCCKAPVHRRVDIFTLNHDLLLERSLEIAAIAYGDGFDDAVNRVRYWKEGKLRRAPEAVRLIKLHGSVNYFAFQPRTRGREEAVGQVLDKDPDHTLDPSGRLQWTTSWRPVMLMGTFNKLQEYLGGIFLEMHWEFLASLAHARTLLVSGYSFGDKGINRPIAQWMHSSDKNRLVLVTPNPDRCKQGARGAIRNWWDEWASEGRLQSIPRGIEEVSWSEIGDVLL